MNFTESINYIYSLGNEVLAMKLGLETVKALASALDNPQRKFPAIHIAGTNGKGSTAAMTEAILRAAKLKTGLFTSPHLVSITERCRVDGHNISEDDFARLATVVRQASETLVANGRLEAPPTFFEQVTMIAYLHFAESKVDLAVLEVGIGGRLDATNICQPLVTAITAVSFDHQQHLGNTLAEIAGEKAGIIKADVPVVVAPQPAEAMQMIVARAAELNAPLISVAAESFAAESVGEFGQYRLRYRGCDATLGLRGRHQTTNAMTAILIVGQLRQPGWKIEEEAIEAGLREVVWPGRLQLIESDSLTAPILADGAHNPAGAETLRSFLDEHCHLRPVTLIFGAMNDKAAFEMAEILFPAARHVILTKADNPRAALPQQLAEMTKKLRQDLGCAESLAEALTEAACITPADG
ncbi:MAG: folylpolyglutamate synthase/dihydrofolate synthase family protein, partial [Acidobacteriota bacterium]